MIKAQNFSYLAIILLTPFFISLKLDYSISFDRSLWVFGEFHLKRSTEQYLITFPISLIVILFYALKFFPVIVRHKYFLSLFAWLFFVTLGNYVFGEMSIMSVKVTLAMIVFILSLCVFDEYFSTVDFDSTVAFEDYYILAPFLILLSLLIWSFAFYRDDSFIVPMLKVYDFDQYLSYALLLFIGAFFKNTMQLLVVFICLLVFADITRSDGIKIILIFLIPIYILYKSNFHWLRKYSVTILTIACSLIICYQALAYFYPNIQAVMPLTLSARIEKIHTFYANTDWMMLLFPLRDLTVRSDHLHNEVLQAISATGVLGALLYYGMIINRLQKIMRVNLGSGISVALVVIVGGALVLPTMHPYTGILIAFFLSFYNSKLYRQSVSA